MPHCSVYNCDMIDLIDKKIMAECHYLLMYNHGDLSEVSKCRGVLGNITEYQHMTPRQRHFLTNWYQENQDKLDWMRF